MQGQTDPAPSTRTGWLRTVLGQRSCKRVLDTACGDGGDSLALVQQGLEVVSCDSSDASLRKVMTLRWKKRTQRGFDTWVIAKASPSTLEHDLGQDGVVIGAGFDAVLCLNDAFATLREEDMRSAISNMAVLLKKGGVMVIDQLEGDTQETGQLANDTNKTVKPRSSSSRPLTLKAFEKLLKTSFVGGYTHTLYAQHRSAEQEGQPFKFYHVIDKI
ncbi:PREDICTED: glycine N-methyltransferase-like isoform X2 [Branchiostoma belcheri]|uniref:Glycine N-methyltransferase n=1 Tax=Branchiostoma belcheri TaxID=7741 RepID=A0A6P4Y533_BRABE|nr:PREDICTED: glycine N-methyltransferase-like isoform X2 [Branchiostoma belcheri]